MPIVNVTSDLKSLLRGVELEQRAQTRAVMRALNSAARGMRTDAGREIHKRYPRLSTRDIGKLIDVQLASAANLVATITVRGRPLSLIRFAAGTRTRRGSGGVWVSVKGQRKFIPHAFIASGRDIGGEGRSEVVFIRKKYAPRSKAGKSGIVALRTVDVPGVMDIKEVRGIVETLTQGRFDKEFERQLGLLAS